MFFILENLNGAKANVCNVTNPNYYNLSLIARFDASETSQMIDELNDYIKFQSDSIDFYQSDSIENINTIEFQYPNVIIDDFITIPMSDLTELLQEWLTFIS